MPRKKKDGRFINYYIDRSIYERLERYARQKGQLMTTAIERILEEHLDEYEAELASKGGISMFCPNCNIPTGSHRCTVCGSRELRLPMKEDYCYLTEKEPLWASALGDILSEHQIPYVTRNTLGAGLAAKIGPAMERVRFFVPYGSYQKAQELEREFFAGEAVEE